MIRTVTLVAATPKEVWDPGTGTEVAQLVNITLATIEVWEGPPTRYAAALAAGEVTIVEIGGMMRLPLTQHSAQSAIGGDVRILQDLYYDPAGASGGGGGGSTTTISIPAAAHAYQSASVADAGDFVAVYASPTTLDLSLLPFPPLFENFVSVAEYDGDNLVDLYLPDDLAVDWTWIPGVDVTTGVLQLATVAFGATNTFVVTLRGPERDALEVLTDFAGPFVHQSPRDFAAVWASATTLTITGMEFDPDKDDFRAVVELTAGGMERMTYTRRSHVFSWVAGAPGAGVLTIAGTVMLAGSSFIVFIEGTEHGLVRADDVGSAASMVKRVSPVRDDGSVIDPSGGGGGASGLVTYLGNVPGSLHFTVTQFSATQLAFTGLSFTLSDITQIMSIKQWDSTGLFVAEFKPEDGVIWGWDTVNNRVTVTGAVFTGTDILLVTCLGQDRTLSLPDDAQKTLNLNSDRLSADSTGIELITVAQNITAAWVDVGPEISTFGYNSLGLWFSFVLNNALDIRIRVVPKHTSAGADEYPIIVETVGSSGAVITVVPAYWEFPNATGKYPISVKTNGIAPYVQVQIQARVAGATPGTVLASYTRGWR